MKLRELSREKKFYINTIVSILNQIISFFSGFIMPKLFLTYFGSEVNGLTSSITQFLGFFTLCEMGVGAVVQSALYKPLVNNDTDRISMIVITAQKFFHKLAFILFGYVLFLMALYPIIVLDSFDYLFTIALIGVLSINSFSQYYFGITCKLLLNADQLSFIQIGLNSICLVLNAIFATILMINGFSIHVVKLTTCLIFLIQPLVLNIYVHKNYLIDKNITIVDNPLPQKWNGVAQHIATVVLTGTDTLVLTLFSSLKNVSIYSVYFIVVNGLRQITLSFTNGMQSMLGNMYYKNEQNLLLRTFNKFEWFIHTFVILVFGCCIFLIVPFVTVYTRNITDANYIQPLFGMLITIAEAMFCLRIPYNMMTLAAGHFKKTQTSAIIEAILNITISIILVINFGLIGVAIGTFVAMTYRTIYLVIYVSNKLVIRSKRIFLKQVLVDIFSLALTFIFVILFKQFYSLDTVSYLCWIILAIKVFITHATICLIVNLIFYFKRIKLFFVR